MKGYRVIEREQLDECFECGRQEKVYAVQRVLSLRRKSARIEGLDAPDGWKEGWIWTPTCEECYKVAEAEEAGG